MSSTVVVTAMSANSLIISAPPANTLNIIAQPGNSLGLTLGGARGAKGIDGGGIGLSVGSQLAPSGTIAFANSNGITFGMSGSSQITASHNGLTTAMQSQMSSVFMETSERGNYLTTAMQSQSSSAFMITSERINYLTTAAQSGHSHGNPTLNLTNINGTTASGSGGLTLSLSANAGGGAALSAGTQSINTGTVIFSNSNGISFGMSGSNQITASHNGLTTAMQSQLTSNYMSTSERVNYFGTAGNTFANSTHSHGNPTLSLTNLAGTTASNSAGFTISLSAGSIPGTTSFSNSNGITFGLNVSTITASHNGLTTAAVSNHSHAFSASGGSSAFQTLNFANSFGVTFTNSNGSVVASHNGLTTAMLSNMTSNFMLTSERAALLTTAMQSHMSSNYMSTSERGNYFGTAGNTFANSTHSHGNPTLNLTNLSGTTASGSNGLTLSLSANAPGAGGGVAIVGGTLTATSGSVTFTGSNGISVGNVGSQIVISLLDSHHVEGLMLSGNNLGTAFSIMSSGSQTINFAGAISGSQNGNAFTISGQTIPGATSFSNSNGVSFGLNGSTITASHNGLTTAMASNASTAFAGTGSGFTGGSISATLTQNTLGLSMSLSHPAWLTTAMASNLTSNYMSTSERANYFSTAGFTFANSTHSHGNPSLQLTNLSGTTASNSAGFTLSLSAAAPGGGGAMSISAGTTSSALSSLVFSNLNGVSFGLNGSTITASAAGGAGGGAALSAGTQSANTGTINFANSNGITFGMSGSNQITASVGAMSYLSGINITISTTNNNTITLSAPNPIAGSTQPGWHPFLPQAEMIGGAQGAGTLFIVPMFIPVPVSFSYCDQVLQISNASNSSGSWTLSMSAGLYSKHSTTNILHLLASGSMSANGTASGSIGSYSLWGGVRKARIPLTSTLGAGNYFMGIWSRTTTGGVAGQTLNQMLMSQNNVSYSGFLGSTTDPTNALIDGMGRYSVSFSTAMPSSVTMSHIQGNSSILLRPPIFGLTV